MNEKKGAVGETLNLIVATAIIVFLLIAFYYLMLDYGGKDLEMAEGVWDLEDDESLLGFLETRLGFEGGEFSVIELILMGEFEKVEEAAFELEKVFGDCYFIRVEVDEIEEVFVSGGKEGRYKLKNLEEFDVSEFEGVFGEGVGGKEIFVEFGNRAYRYCLLFESFEECDAYCDVADGGLV